MPTPTGADVARAGTSIRAAIQATADAHRSGSPLRIAERDLITAQAIAPASAGVMFARVITHAAATVHLRSDRRASASRSVTPAAITADRAIMATTATSDIDATTAQAGAKARRTV